VTGQKERRDDIMLLLLLWFLWLRCFVHGITFTQLDFSLCLEWCDGSCCCWRGFNSAAKLCPGWQQYPLQPPLVLLLFLLLANLCWGLLKLLPWVSGSRSVLTWLCTTRQPNLGAVAGLIQADPEARRAAVAIRPRPAPYWQAGERRGMEIFLSSGILQVDSW